MRANAAPAHTLARTADQMAADVGEQPLLSRSRLSAVTNLTNEFAGIAGTGEPFGSSALKDLYDRAQASKANWNAANVAEQPTSWHKQRATPQVSAEVDASNARMAKALTKTTDLSTAAGYLKDALKTGGPQAQLEANDLVQKLDAIAPGQGQKLAEMIGLANRPRMDEAGNWFDPNGARISNPYQSSDLRLVSDLRKNRPQSPIDNPAIRNDYRGKGHFGAKRDGGTRPHMGIDLLAKAGTFVKSPISGRIEIRNTYPSKVDPFNGKYKNVWVIDEDGNQYGLGYVSPKDTDGKAIVRNGQTVEAGDVIGILQNRAGEDKEGIMKNHMHFMRKDKDGNYIDPTETVNRWLEETPKN